MGRMVCEHGVTHNPGTQCRCSKEHMVKCDQPEAHAAIPAPEHICLVLEMKLDGRLPMGKHEGHGEHFWWYTSYGGGHQMDHYDVNEKNMKKWHCPGLEPN